MRDIHNMSEYPVPELREVFEAMKTLRRFFGPSPLARFSGLDREVGSATYLKLENLLPTGSFKIRGATYLISSLSEEERKNGVIVASTGNFAQGVSYAASMTGTAATVVMPENSNPVKVRATRELGGDIIFHGEKFDDARRFAESLAVEKGYRYIHSANEPMLVAGVGTHTLEMLLEMPDLERIIVPVGGGSGVAGACLVAKALDPEIEVIGVQSESSQAAYLSWKKGEIVTAPNDTFAEGVATSEGFGFTQGIMKRYLDDFVLVSDSDIRNAMKLMIRETRIVPESASASSLAALLSIGGRGKTALVITGGNVAPDQLREIMS